MKKYTQTIYEIYLLWVNHLEENNLKQFSRHGVRFGNQWCQHVQHKVLHFVTVVFIDNLKNKQMF